MRESDKTEEFRRLALGRLLAEISGKMNQRATGVGRNLPRILIHSTHDTAIAGILGTLEVFDDRYALAHRIVLDCVAPFELLLVGPTSRRL